MINTYYTFNLQSIYDSRLCETCEDARDPPRPYLSRSITLQHSGRWESFNLPLVTFFPNGRMGNLMGQYATLFALSKMYNASSVLLHKHKKLLTEHFPNLSLPYIAHNKCKFDQMND